MPTESPAEEAGKYILVQIALGERYFVTRIQQQLMVVAHRLPPPLREQLGRLSGDCAGRSLLFFPALRLRPSFIQIWAMPRSRRRRLHRRALMDQFQANRVRHVPVRRNVRVEFVIESIDSRDRVGSRCSS